MVKVSRPKKASQKTSSLKNPSAIPIAIVDPTFFAQKSLFCLYYQPLIIYYLVNDILL